MICDLAETYRIYDYRSLPVKYLAILVSGLSEDSRVGMKRAGWKAPRIVVYTAVLCDIFESYISALQGQEFEPQRAKRLLVDESQDEPKQKGFDIDRFEAIRQSVLKD